MMPHDASRHLHQLHTALDAFADVLPVLERWGDALASWLQGGGRLLAAGNGGSAAQAQHLTAELVGRFSVDRPPLSAMALHAETSSMTALLNDYGADAVFARQVAAHGRPGDVLLLMSTSGRSQNLLEAADTGSRVGLRVWALTGPLPNPLAARADESVAVAAPEPATVQEVHLVAVHVLAAAVDCAVIAGWSTASVQAGGQV